MPVLSPAGEGDLYPSRPAAPPARLARAPDEDGLPTPRRHLAAAAVLAAIVLAVLDGAIANVALPTIAGALRVSPAASSGSSPATRWRWSWPSCPAPRSARAWATAGFVGRRRAVHRRLGPARSPTTLPWLVAARFLQGLGGAAIMSLIAPCCASPTRSAAGTAIGRNALVVALSSAARARRSGAAILSVAGWPWLFAVNLPVGAVGAGSPRAPCRPPRHGAPRSTSSAWRSNAGVFGPLVVGVDLATARPWLGDGLMAMAALCLVALLRREMPREAPLIPLDLLRSGPFRISVIASVCCFAAQMVSYVALPFYLQHGLGRNALTAGLYMTPWPLTVARPPRPPAASPSACRRPGSAPRAAPASPSVWRSPPCGRCSAACCRSSSSRW